jgi:hypothetical protein
MSDELQSLWVDHRATAERLAAHKAARESVGDGWSPTHHLQFVERGSPPRHILQQLWVATGQLGQFLDFAEWRDVPAVKESTNV